MTTSVENLSKAIGLPQSEEARENRRKHLKIPMAIGAAALASTAIFHNLQSDESFSPSSVQHTVQSGETLWSIANDVTGHEDVNINVIVDEIKDRNPGLEGGNLPAGMQINVPESVED